MIIPSLGSRECRVWWADIRHQPITSLTSVLSETELGRAAHFHRESDRRRFVTGCWLLRTTAAAQLATSPAAVSIERRCPECDKPHGKPRIRSDMATLEASISHSGNRVGVALSTAGPIGVDVEEVAASAMDGIAHCALSPRELQALQELPKHEEETGFIRIWVRKEAALKATGHGLRISPELVEVSGPREEPALLSWPLDIDPRTVQIHPLDPGDGYTGVVAILTDGEPVEVSESDATSLHRIILSSPAPKAA